jgi:hypothetical protein
VLAASDIDARALDPGLYREQDDPEVLWAPRGGASMPTYVNLVRWTDQGIQNYKDSPGCAADFAKLIESCRS